MADTQGRPAYGGDVVPELPGYRIERELGRGSMGVVYLAEDVQLRRKVALKILAPTLSDDELFRKRFDRESQSAANLDHPHIVPVYAAGEAGGLLYIAMRYVGGGDLRTLLDVNGPLNLHHAATVVASVADALDAAHDQGMIHRDVKPANILVDGRNGQEHYYLSDFGITKIVSSGRSLTSTGQIVGTVDYIAPEQIQGKPVDGRADLYALGCVLYQCLTGVVPFPRDETAALMWAHVHDEASPVTTRRPNLPPQIDHIVAKAMAKQPEDRYNTCRELALALQVLAAGPASPGDNEKILPARPPATTSPPAPISSGMTSTYTPPTPAPAQAPVRSSPSRRWGRWLAAGVVIFVLAAGSTVGVMKYLNSRFPNAAEQALLGQVPLALTRKNGCTRNAEAEQDTANVLASVTCTSDGDAANTVIFTKFASAKALDSHYQATVAAVGGIGQNSGSCLNADRAENTYTSESGQTRGRSVCYEQRGSSFVAWTDDRVHTLAQATRVDPDYMKLRDWWAGVVGLPTSAETEAKAQAKKQVEEAQKRADDATKKAEEDRRQLADDARKQDEDNRKQIADAKKQANEDRKRDRDAQKQDRNKGNQDQNNRRQGQDNTGATTNQNGGGATTGGQNLQQQIDDAVKRATQQQGNSSGGRDLQQQIEDSVKKSFNQYGNAGGQDIQQLVNDALKLAQEQAGQGRR
ncbi:MAG: protein kinase domain-containing protein [Pseudonocardiaceae bacterium]